MIRIRISHPKTRTLRVAFLLLLTAGASGAGAPALAQMNVLVIMTDDQRFDLANRTPNIAALASQGVTFSNAFMPTPLCGPSRAMLYSGGYRAQNTGLVGNDMPNGGATIFNDAANLGAMLQPVGYRTLFVGKWINGYEGMGRYIPPGWTQWVGRHSYATSTNWSSFQYITGSSSQASSLGSISTARKYTTYFERDEVLNFLSTTPAGQPFFVLWTPTAPHPPATPVAQDAQLFPAYRYRGRGFGETDLSDKPAWVRKEIPAEGSGDGFVRNQLRSLQSVDRSVRDVINRLKSLGVYNNTVIIFTSDNGSMWGEHGLWGKNKMYEESLRVPLAVVMPGVAPRTDPSLVAASLDIGPTIFQIAGITKQTDGMSLVPLLTTPGIPWRTDIFLEGNEAHAGANAIWAGIRDNRYKYVRYWTGDEELYDLNVDPYELRSLHNNPAQSARKSAMWASTQQQLGLAIVPVVKFPIGNVGTQFSYQMRLWGGSSPFSWTVASGQLPPGLSLDASTGLIQGMPDSAGVYEFSVRVTDSSLATQTGKARTFETRLRTLTVNP